MRLIVTIIGQQNKPVAGANVSVTDPLTKNNFSFISDANGNVWIEIPDPYVWEYGVSSIPVTVTAPGYAILIVTQRLDLTTQNKNVIYQLEKQTGNFPFWLIAIAVFLVMQYRKKTGKVGKLNETDVKTIILATGGVIGFVLLKQLLEFLGVWDSGETKQLDQSASDPNSFWNPTFWQTKPAYIQWTAPLTEAQAKALAQNLYDYISWTGDKEEEIKAIFRGLRAQSSVSYISFVFNQMFQKDLLSFLRGGWWPFDGLSDADLFEINTFISKLPKY